MWSVHPMRPKLVQNWSCERKKSLFLQFPEWIAQGGGGKIQSVLFVCFLCLNSIILGYFRKAEYSYYCWMVPNPMWGTPRSFVWINVERRRQGIVHILCLLVLWQWHVSIVQTSCRHERWDKRWKNFPSTKEVFLFDGDLPGVKQIIGPCDFRSFVWIKPL